MDRDTAFAELRVVFAGLYNELRRRGHEVIVMYESPSDPYYIPRFVAIDDLLNRVDLDFGVSVIRYNGPMKYEVVVTVTHMEPRGGRDAAQRGTRLTCTPERLADWLVRKARRAS